MKNKKGITLIALIITIVVLLILAGVSISIVTGDNGLLSQAQDSKVKTDKAHIQEMKDLTSARAAMNLDGYTDEKTGVYIPSGFAVSENPEEQTIEKGLVIIDKMGDEFVWIPVNVTRDENNNVISSNYVKRATNKVYKLGVTDGGVSLEDDYGTNDFLTNNGGEISIVTKAKGFFVSRYEIGADGAEQRNLTGGDNISYNSKIGAESGDAYTDAEKALYWSQANDTQKRAIIDRILPQLQSKQGIEPVRRMTQDECLILANSWKSGKDYQSGLITGTQWDRMVSWICDAGETGAFEDASDKPLGNCTSWGNYKSNLSITYNLVFTSGNTNGQWISRTNGWSRTETEETDIEKLYNDRRFVFPTGEFISYAGIDTKKKNIYDVAENVWEWTTEVSKYYINLENNKYENRVVRGGSANDAGDEFSATSRSGSRSATASAIWDIGFRVVLYVTK